METPGIFQLSTSSITREAINKGMVSVSCSSDAQNEKKFNRLKINIPWSIPYKYT